MEGAAAGFANISIAMLIMVALVCFAAAALSGMSGFGGGVLISIFIAPIVGIDAVLPVMSVLALIMNGSRVVAYFGSLQPRVALPLLATSLPGALAGSLFYVAADSRLVTAILGVALILSVPIRRYLDHKKIYLSHRGLVMVGLPFGFLSGTTIGAGMLLVPLMLGAGLAGPALLATDAVVAVGINVLKIAIFGKFSALTPELALAGLVMGLCAVPGTWLASWIVARTDVRIHTIFMELLVVAGGMSFIYGGFK